LFLGKLEENAVGRFDGRPWERLQAHLHGLSIESEVVEPGTAGHVHSSHLLWENQQAIIASLKTSGQSYDFIEVTRMGRMGPRASVSHYWINYVVCVQTGDMRRRIDAEFKSDKDGDRWESSSGKRLFTSNLGGKQGIVKRPGGKVKEGEATLAERLNADRALMEDLRTLAGDKQCLDVWPSHKDPCCTYSQAVDVGHLPFKVEVDIADRIARHLRDFAPRTF
jgi:hypothetical protein